MMKFLKTAIALLLFAFVVEASAQPLWMRYPSISPDGQSIVFSYKGNLYKVPTAGGDALPLTIHQAHDYQPVWSPDGKFIAFASNRFGNFDIFIMPANGGQARRLTYHSANEVPCSFTPNGQQVLYSSQQLDDYQNSQFPYGLFSELYKVDVTTSSIDQLLTTPAELAMMSNDGSFIVYQDVKGYEDRWRKHHQSSVTRDIWKMEISTGKHTKLSSFKGEDRQPVLASNEKDIYFLSEQFGSFNVCKTSINQPANVEQISHFKKHPVRFLSVSDNDVLCYSFNGELYTQKPGAMPAKVVVNINFDIEGTDTQFVKMSKEATEMDVSPNGKEIAFVARGEVFVTSVDYNTTKRVTNTPGQERSVSFSPDGRSLVYAAERNGSWNVYTSSIKSDDELYFSNATLIEEKPVIEVEAETFQPHFSPDGKEVAFLENRTTLKVINLDTKAVRTILEGTYNYSYSDGDQWYQWSPDGKWFIVAFCPNHWVIDEVGLVAANGSGEVKNLTQSGYGDSRPQWMMNGNAVIWFTDKHGMRNHGSWGSHDDVYAMFFNQKSYDQFKLSKEELELKEELEKSEKEEEESKDKKKKKKSAVKEEDSIEMELDNLEDRMARLTIHSSSLAGALLSPDADKLYYLSRFEKGHDLWMHDFKKNETKKIAELDGRGGYMQADSAFANIFVFSGGQITKFDTKSDKTKAVNYNAEMYLDAAAEREAIFDHAWRQVKRKWYRPDLHNVDWDFYKAEYERFLPHVNNNYDFQELLSEMLGEMNGSHTGARYRPKIADADKTASLGLFFDYKYNGKGLKITEVIDKSPVLKEGTKIKAGTVVESVNGVGITNFSDLYQQLNHQEGKPTLLAMYNPASGKRWQETVKPISLSKRNQLLYERWIKQRREMTERLSGGRLGYVHVKGMDSPSFREFYSEVLGRNHDKEALIVDTRFNGGGWLHDDLVTFLSGKKYADYYPGGRYFGSEPIAKWNKPSCVLISEGNYSDAHAFPFAYNALKIGKLIGMPVPGTMTAVWWETQQDKTLVFGIPQIGVKDMDGNYLENTQLEPDVKVQNSFELLKEGRDEQLEKAIEVMLNDLK
ncbi:PD40 domain-containing protein [Carboxylicivirga sp. A043]|uniref:S41 family peptidase n=1 Tax=Carboxylicivirga litoralis TaxID=2816963 RepID=UPI0021CB73CB|nr:S41 family peptidase [Carboxylicivirga sp. A043]MCU4156579.1 PD40 domain-containing protein [Carboxylicivirga sp. A043]